MILAIYEHKKTTFEGTKKQRNKQRKKSKTHSIIVGINIFQTMRAPHGFLEWKLADMFKSPLCLHILTIGVINEARRMGVGKKLISLMCELYKIRLQVKAISLDVIDYNNVAINFYKRIGFVKIGVKVKHYELFGKRYDALVLIKYLNGAKGP